MCMNVRACMCVCVSAPDLAVFRSRSSDMVFALSRRGWPVPGGLPIDVCRQIRLLASNVACKWCRLAAGVMQRVWRYAAGAPTEDDDMATPMAPTTTTVTTRTMTRVTTTRRFSTGGNRLRVGSVATGAPRIQRRMQSCDYDDSRRRTAMACMHHRAIQHRRSVRFSGTIATTSMHHRAIQHRRSLSGFPALSPLHPQASTPVALLRYPHAVSRPLIRGYLHAGA